MIVKNYEFVVVGGGISGICAAIAAARRGVQTALIHNRPVLGGNASSEIRMHICGADNHMKKENARETGILEEILLENKRRNPEMVYPIFDTVLWEKVHFQKNLTLYLNAHMTHVKSESGIIEGIYVEQLTTEKVFYITGNYFADTTGDGVLGFKAGAEFRLGRESKEEFGETLALNTADSFTMGNSLMFQARDMGRSVPFIKPFWANTYTEEQLKFRDHSEITSGYWWVELGGSAKDCIADGEEIRDELLKAVYGVWDHIKNGGDHGAGNMELEWVGSLPGKRESRRLMGDYVLTEKDCYEGRIFEDAVAYGGWSMDIHIVDGFLREEENPTVWNELKDIYTLPYRCLYSKNINNLFLGGRAISCTHVSFSSTRVMGTCAVVGQAIGTAAAIATQNKISPRQVGNHIKQLQQELLKDDCYIPGYMNQDSRDYARSAIVTASDYIKGYEPELIINGISRSKGQNTNCWRAKIESMPSVSFALTQLRNIGELIIFFDSNLSREIMPSLSDRAKMRQEKHSPSELVKDYNIYFYQYGSLVNEMKLESFGQRSQKIQLEEPILADEIQIKVLSTYGSENATIFEVRIYGEK